MYYRGQRLLPSPLNPILYQPHDFAIFEGMDGDRLILTIIQRRRRSEPTHWWTARIEERRCQRRCLALYRNYLPVTDILAILHELAPTLHWVQNAPLDSKPLNPYRFQGFFGSESRILELDPEAINNVTGEDLRSLLADIVRAIAEDLRG